MNFLKDKAFSLDQKQIDLFQKFYTELKFFQHLFLTKKETEKEVVELIEDGITSGTLFLKSAPEETFVDIGSGAGFPGVVLAILDLHRKIILVEPSAKRAEFLRHIVDTFDFQNRVIVREEVFSFMKERIVLFKAFAPLKKTLQMVKKYLPEDGVSYHFKGPLYEKDWDRLSLKEKKLWQMKVFVEYKFKNQNRVILEIKKKSTPHILKNINL
ncbi:MAG: class I SAM-dependent methyltransferase [Bdellovibrionales bacterium]|nr:class I SAM-dependent methyltransferase [Bdellovibrionales bacterium]